MRKREKIRMPLSLQTVAGTLAMVSLLFPESQIFKMKNAEIRQSIFRRCNFRSSLISITFISVINISVKPTFDDLPYAIRHSLL